MTEPTASSRPQMAKNDYPILYGPGSEKPHKHPTWPLSVPWDMVTPHEAQARRNHSQTLKRLAERGGLCLQEMVAVLTDVDWKQVKHLTYEEAATTINNLIEQWKDASSVPECITEREPEAVPEARQYTNRQGEPCSTACGEGRHEDCTETLETCNCTYRGRHKTLHRYASYASLPAVPEAPETQKLNEYGLTPAEWNECVVQGCALHDALHNVPEGEDYYDTVSMIIMSFIALRRKEKSDLESLLRKIVSEAQEWVSVETAMPEETVDARDLKSVIVLMANGDVDRAMLMADDGCPYWWSFGHDQELPSRVTDWMPYRAPVSGKSAISEAKEFLEKR